MTFPNEPSPNRFTFLYFSLIVFTSLDSFIRDTFRVTLFGYARRKSLVDEQMEVVVVVVVVVVVAPLSLLLLLLAVDLALKTSAGSCFRFSLSSVLFSVDLEGTQPILCEERRRKILSRGTLSLESINEVFVRILNDTVGKLIKSALFRRISTIISVI